MTARSPAAAAATLVVAASLALAACGTDPTPTPRPACPTAPPSSTGAQAELVGADRAVVATNKGTFTMDIYGDAAPIAAANFVALARCGFYDQITFHRVIAGFVIQAGDPQTRENRDDFEGLGTGGPGFSFVIEEPADGLTYDPYVVSMANAGGTDTNGSQFFINLVDLDDALRQVGTYTIFGRVIEGTGVVDEIGEVPVNHPQVGVPLDPVIIESITIEAAPAETDAAPSG
jgi:cyclophilin family peptidyl-prolyl cis-trans isomerase